MRNIAGFTGRHRIDISEWAGQNVELFVGLNPGDSDNIGGSVMLENISFQAVPEPTFLAEILIGTLILMQRGRAS